MENAVSKWEGNVESFVKESCNYLNIWIYECLTDVSYDSDLVAALYLSVYDFFLQSTYWNSFFAFSENFNV